jgi:hypothetical protein
VRLEGHSDASSEATRALGQLLECRLNLHAAALAFVTKTDASSEIRDLYARENVRRPEAFSRIFFPG